jgi:hypothetical protein
MTAAGLRYRETDILTHSCLVTERDHMAPAPLLDNEQPAGDWGTMCRFDSSITDPQKGGKIFSTGVSSSRGGQKSVVERKKVPREFEE